MHTKFLALGDEKQQRIINAALSEFAAKGYRHASTDRIVEKAGISKGALFHYFGSKEKLYLFLLDWTSDTLYRAVTHRLDPGEPDLFVRLMESAYAKMEVLREHPDVWRFWDSFESERPEIAAEWMTARIAKSSPLAGQLLLEGIDTSRFRPELDLSKLINVMVWTFSGWTDATWAHARRQGEMIDLERAFADVQEYVDFLKAAFYKTDPDGG